MHVELSTPVAARLLVLARRNVAARSSSIHTAADRHVNAMIVAVTYGILRARKALKSASDEDAAVSAMQSALEESLPPVLLKTIAAGGEAGVAGLRKLRIAGGPGSGWTAENGHVPLSSPSRLDVKREIIGTIDSRGSVTAKNTTPQFNDHTQMGTASRPGSQRFRVNGNEVQWDDDPEDDDRFAVEDWLAKHGLDGVRHVVLAKRMLGGPGSGNFGHAGRPGEIGGSEGSGSLTVETTSNSSGPYVTISSPYGRIGGGVREGVLHINATEVKSEERGKGHGVTLYKAMVDHAFGRGLDVASDETVESGAAHVYQALGRRGYNVVRNPNAYEFTLDDGSKAWSGRRNPVFTIKRGSRRAAELRTAKPASKRPLRMKFNVTDPNVVKAAKKHAAKLITDITKTTRKRIHDAIVGAVEGDGFKAAYETILDAIGDKDRARLIARHETMNAASIGQRESWSQAVDAGLLDEGSKRTWIVTGDDKTCPICEELDGATADLDGEYPGGYEGPPAHVACRCTEGIVS